METTTLLSQQTLEQDTEKSDIKKTKSQSISHRLMRVDQIYSREDYQTHFVETAKSSLSKEQNDLFNQTVLLVRRIIGDQGMIAGIEVDIKSSALKDLLLQVFDGVEGLKLNQDPPVVDPQLLFHAVPALITRMEEEETAGTPNQLLVNDISTALEYVLEDFGRDTANLKSLSKYDEITFDLLWAIFPPRCIVFTKQTTLTEPQVLKFKSGSYENNSGQSFFSLKCQIITHDGQDFGYGDDWLRIDKFEGTRKISALSAFPLSAHPDSERIRVQLIKRGRKYIQLLEQSCCKDYSGIAVKEGMNPEGGKTLKFYATGRIMLDPITFRHQNPNSTLIRPRVQSQYPLPPNRSQYTLPIPPPPPTKRTQYPPPYLFPNPTLLGPQGPVLLDAKRLGNDELLLCNHYILGFSFPKKTWGIFAVSRVTDVAWNEAAFSQLVMDPKRRDLIHSLVKSHRNTGAMFDDFIQDKGKGLVGLLSGKPGVGKTLTAEVVAEATKRPLYMVSAGELGTNVEDVDKQLEMVLDITRRWGCVLLIDEADVFLQARVRMDIKQNALVSVFLRRLEYFQGVLILTTNRRSAIDDAFQSRIHFKVHYPDLDENSRAAVWRNFSSSLSKELFGPPLSETDVQTLATMPLNGRQIKNAMSCALSISREDQKPLTVEGIRTILEVLMDE